jgi:UDP-N-acetylglucosamine diphosphorylase / glucose-1-phosphate thymidylyltransferase / UDP-N-acetylgalactosamine diphosphorylase / glucosamine-1-phosphate N-acetyltransferase / galactosamine-1-phosphate N-acetyltransferase
MPEEITKGVILAAGRGTRMRELTDDVPKPMVQVRGKPVLLYIVEGFRAAGINQVLIVVGYRREAIEDYFRDGSAFGLRIRYVEQVVQDGTGKVLELAREFCGADPFLLSYGDILVHQSCYRELVSLAGAEMALTVRYANDVSKGGAVYLNEAFEVVDLREKQSPAEVGTHWYNAGIYVFRSSVFPFIRNLQRSARGEYELTDPVRALAQTGHKIKALEIKGDWADVRDPEVLAELNKG